ncbi:MAG TPA: PEP-CTERM sorting domain-containing protein [Steroidobacteraceae bacterium]|nr:PEP-CTERM sorting domain-containing protein [Steroidobacteraceae bacterium]
MIGNKRLTSALAAGLLLITASSAFASIMSDSALANDGLSVPSQAVDPAFVLSIDLMGNDATASLNALDIGGGAFLATSGTLHVTAGADLGTYSLFAGGPAEFISPSGAFIANDVLYYPGANPFVDTAGLLFAGNGTEINIFGDAPGVYSFMSWNGGNYNVDATGIPSSVSLHEVPEPGTLALFGIGLVLLGAGAAKQRLLKSSAC